MADVLSYLDSPDHVWEIDPDIRQEPLLLSMQYLIQNGTEEAAQFVLKGYAGLKQRHPEATDRECLGTAMMWWFG